MVIRIRKNVSDQTTRRMPLKPNIFSSRVRKRKAYATAFQVFISYYWLYLKSRLFGQAYFDKRINALHVKNADRIKRRMQELQGLFIKIGQLISNLTNVLPKEFRAPLEELQDHITAKPYAEIEQTIVKYLGKKPEELFSSFEKEPLAAASIGQVHRATLDGKAIVVKIQHHNIDKIAEADLAILKNLVKIHAYFMDMHGLEHTYQQVRQMIEEELDYTKEAEAMQQIAQNLSEADDLGVKIPTVLTDYSSKKVLVTEFCEGTNIGHIETLQAWGLDIEQLAKRLIELYCKMILVDGYYHADPHPGNILVNQEGEIILLDFGAVAHLNEATKQAIPDLIEAVIRNDTEETVRALKRMGFIGTDKASRKYVEKLIDIFKEFLQNEVQLDGLNFQNIKLNSGLSSVASIIRKVDLREVSNSIRIPKDYILLNRAIVLLIGNVYKLAPALNSLDVVRPYVKKHILSQKGGFTQLIVKTVQNQISTVISLPNELSQFLKNANESELEQAMHGINHSLQRIRFLSQQFLYFFVLVALVYFLLTYESISSFWQNLVQWGLIPLFIFLFLRSMYRERKV